MNGYEVLVEEYWERKSELLLDKRAQELFSPPQIQHAQPRIEVTPSPWENEE
jgi:hypothetical protein